MSLNETKAFKKTLSCILTQKELLERGELLGRLLEQVESSEAERQAENKQRKQEIGGLQAEVQRVSRQIRERAEWRDVDCVIDVDVARNEASTRRLDTGEVVESRTLTATERQTKIALDGTTDPVALDGTRQVGTNS